MSESRGDKDRRMPVLLASGLVLGTLLVIALGVHMGPLVLGSMREVKPVGATFSAYAGALVQKDYARAYGLSSPEFQSAVSYEKFAGQQRTLEAHHGRLISVERGGTEVTIRESESEWRAVINAEHRYERLHVTFVYELHHAGGRWSVYGYRESD